MPIAYAIPTTNVTNTAAYPFTDKRDQSTSRVLWSDSYGCVIDNAAAAFTQVRETHRKLGWKRAVLDEQGNKTGEIEYVEGLHLIISFADDELDPTNPEDWERCGELARKVAREQFPGYQFVLAVQADGESGKLHAHIVVNSISFEDAVDNKGHVRRAGRVMGGWVSNVEVIRSRVDAVSAELGIKQNLPAYEPSKPVERGVSRTDRQLERRGKRSQRDVCRDLVDELIHDGVSADELPAKMSEHGWSMSYRVKASGKSKGASFTKFKHVDDARGMSATGQGGSADLGLGYTPEGIERRVRERALELEQERRDAAVEIARLEAEAEAERVAKVEAEKAAGQVQPAEPAEPEMSKPVESTLPAESAPVEPVSVPEPAEDVAIPIPVAPTLTDKQKAHANEVWNRWNAEAAMPVTGNPMATDATERQAYAAAKRRQEVLAIRRAQINAALNEQRMKDAYDLMLAGEKADQIEAAREQNRRRTVQQFTKPTAPRTTTRNRSDDDNKPDN